MSRLISNGATSGHWLGVKLLLGAGLTFSCAGILGIEEATCSDQFNGCPGFEGDGDVSGDGDDTDDGDGGGDGDVIGDGDPTGDAGEADSGDPVDPVELCDEYCSEIMDNCTADEDIQYPSHAFCMNVCAHYELGVEGELGNTLYCRLERARNAAISETALNCQIAGPSGGDACGDLCDNFCDFEVEICPEEFGTRAACVTECESLVDRETYNSGADMQSGPEAQCRLYHVNAAATDPAVHCRHTGGVDPCN
jgi:hypothetical protein